MTTMLKGVTITFEKPVREDDAKMFLHMLHSLKNVASVNPVEEVPADMIAVQAERARICDELMELTLDVVYDQKRKK